MREVQKIITGHTICPASNDAHDTLITRTSDIETLLSIEGECKVEKLEQFSAFQLFGILRTYLEYDGSGKVLMDITGATIAQALTDLTNVTSLNGLEYQSFTGNQFLHKKN